jgi:serine/threonine protein kinase
LGQPKIQGQENKKRTMSCFKDSHDIISTNDSLPHINEGSLFRGVLEDYIVSKDLGKGSYAVVKQAYHKPTGMKLAIKIYDKFKLNDPAKKNAVKREIQILKQIDHPNVVKLYEVIDNPKQVIIFLFI